MSRVVVIDRIDYVIARLGNGPVCNNGHLYYRSDDPERCALNQLRVVVAVRSGIIKVSCGDKRRIIRKIALHTEGHIKGCVRAGCDIIECPCEIVSISDRMTAGGVGEIDYAIRKNKSNGRIAI